MKVFITGGLGQIGSHIAELLLERDDEVLVIDNGVTGRRDHLKPHKNLESVSGSIADKELVDSLIEKFQPHVVIHAAASYKDPDDWYNDTLTNCTGGANVIDAAKKFEVDRFIYFQTALCYGNKPVEQPITLNHPRNPAANSYAISKTTNELYLEMSGLNYVTFRLANAVGPRNSAGPLPIFYQRLKDGKQCFVTRSRRDFIYVKDLVPVVIKAVDGTGQGAYHFSSGSDISIKELYDAVVRAMNLTDYPEPDIRELGPDDVFSILLDPSKTFEDFGEIQFTPLQEIVNSAVEYFDEYGTMGEFTHLRMKE